MMKKLMSVLLAGLMVAAMTACGSSPAPPPTLLYRPWALHPRIL